MTLNLVSNAGLSGNKGSRVISGIGAGGVRNANFTNTATGQYSDNGISYKFVRFTGNGTLTIDEPGLADILVVGGGGGGGARMDAGNGNRRTGSGAGAGGAQYVESFFLEAGSYTVIVGGGGAGGLWASNSGVNGNNSSIVIGSKPIAVGYGGARGISNGIGGNAALLALDLQGSVGSTLRAGIGQGNVNDFYGTGGGGGGAGGDATNTNVAGIGRTISITGSSVTYGTGGISRGPALSKSANSGDGGDGTSNDTNASAGGSGVVVVRVQV